MMEEETLRLIIINLNELKTEINAGQEELKGQLKTDISAVTAGQEELKNDMNSEISAVKMTSRTASAL
jgi:hypothetical protein